MAFFLIDLKPVVITYEEVIPKLIKLVFKLYGKIQSHIRATDFDYVKNNQLKIVGRIQNEVWK